MTGQGRDSERRWTVCPICGEPRWNDGLDRHMAVAHPPAPSPVEDVPDAEADARHAERRRGA